MVIPNDVCVTFTADAVWTLFFLEINEFDVLLHVIYKHGAMTAVSTLSLFRRYSLCANTSAGFIERVSIDRR